MTIDEILERILLALLRTFDHVMYGAADSELFLDLGIIGAAFAGSMFVFIIVLFMFMGMFGGCLADR